MTLITLIATLAWTATWGSIILRLRKDMGWQPNITLLNSIWSLSLISHGILVLQPWLNNNPSAYGLWSSLNIVMWLSCLILYLAHLRRPLETMGLIIIPLTIISLLLTLLSPGTLLSPSIKSGLGLHILLSLLAYSMLGLATLQALLLAVQNKQLHNHQPNGLIRTLPPLQDMETLLFQLIMAGVILLTLSLLSGVVFLDSLFGKQVAHKTILSLLAWLTFTALLFGHWRYGWRGKIAIRWTVIGFVLLMLAFLGSKFVFEYLVSHT